MNEHVTRTVPITLKMVADAYHKVKRGGQAAGIDGESWKDLYRFFSKLMLLCWSLNLMFPSQDLPCSISTPV